MKSLPALLLAPLSLTLAPPSELHAQNMPTELVVFGASSADAGNVYNVTGGILAAPPYWQGRFTNGPNWVDRLAGLLNVPVPGPSVLGGTNYAFGGAGTGSGFSNACFRGICAPNIGLQIEYYLATSPAISTDQLFVLQGGGNDFLNFTGLDNAMLTAYEMRVNIETLAAAGATNFAVTNLGLDNLSPTKWRQSNNVWIDVFNAALEAHLRDLETRLGLHIARVDFHWLKSAMIASPGDFGLTNVTDPAWVPGYPIVPNPEEYYYWDGAHPTTVVHAFLAELAYLSVLATLAP